MKKSKDQTIGEEIANSITHGVGFGLGIAALSILVSLAAMHGDAWRVTSFALYGTSLILLYMSSMFYHAFRGQRVKKVFRILDHASIFLLIAGTYTPFTLVSLRGPWGWTLFGTVWGIAILGIVLKIFFTGRFDFLSTLLYILMGWIVVIVIHPLLQALPFKGIVWLVAGGLCYTIGIIFYAWKRLPFGHTVWHLFVLGGSICHFFGIFFYVLPMQ